jgi:putative transposase
LKMWAHLNREGIGVARCTVERLMRANGWHGATRVKRVRTTVADPAATRAPDLVERQFHAVAPGQLHVADFTYIRLIAGTGTRLVYTAFVVDAYAGRIVGWECSASKHASFVERAAAQATTLRARQGKPLQNKAIHHSDAGSQGEFDWSSQRLDRGGVDGQAGGVDEGVDGQDADEVAGQAVAAPRRGAVVLAWDRQGVDQRGRRDRGRRVAGGREPVVPGAWRHADVPTCPGHGPVPVV